MDNLELKLELAHALFSLNHDLLTAVDVEALLRWLGDEAAAVEGVVV